MINTSKINSLIQFARASRSIVYKQTLDKEVMKKRIHLIIKANDISPLTCSEFSVALSKVESISYADKASLGSLLGKEDVAIFGISNPNIAKEIIKLVNQKEDA
jgi:ribosomal protein L7Ae-like RNA K-turn-binding protein